MCWFTNIKGIQLFYKVNSFWNKLSKILPVFNMERRVKMKVLAFNSMLIPTLFWWTHTGNRLEVGNEGICLMLVRYMDGDTVQRTQHSVGGMLEATYCTLYTIVSGMYWWTRSEYLVSDCKATVFSGNTECSTQKGWVMQHWKANLKLILLVSSKRELMWY